MDSEESGDGPVSWVLGPRAQLDPPDLEDSPSAWVTGWDLG